MGTVALYKIVAVPMILSVRRYIMIDVLLVNGDLVANKYGDIMACADESDDVVQTANNNILMRFGGNKFHDSLGNKIYSKRIKANQSGIETVQAECANAIINGDPRIRDVKQVIVTLLDNARCMVDYVVTYAKTKEEVLEEDDEDDDVETDVDTIEAIEEEEEEIVEVDGRTYISAFNMEGGE